MLITAIAGLVVYGCVELFEPQSINFENALVIEATITNEMKQQQITLSRTFAFEEEAPKEESNANVMIADDSGNKYVFQETSPGKYTSSVVFAAQPHRNYQLFVTTNDGRSYTSETIGLTNATQIDDLYAKRITTDLGEEGMAIFVDTSDPSSNSTYYRYEYEETYKIVAPNWHIQNLVSAVDIGYILVRKTTEEHVCYSTDVSTRIIQVNTNGFMEDRVSKFLVRFINRNNYIISHRYTILVRQYVQSFEAYNFMETLNEFSSSESLFSETQAGFLEGNVFSEDNRSEKVLGYFDVSTVSEKRIFFDYTDFFPNERLPPYANKCRIYAPSSRDLAGFLHNDQVRYVANNDNPLFGEGPFYIVPRVCGDCTKIGKIEIPGFWIE